MTAFWPRMKDACVPSFMAGMGPGRPVASAILGNEIEPLAQDTVVFDEQLRSFPSLC